MQVIQSSKISFKEIISHIIRNIQNHAYLSPKHHNFQVTIIFSFSRKKSKIPNQNSSQTFKPPYNNLNIIKNNRFLHFPQIHSTSLFFRTTTIDANRKMCPTLYLASKPLKTPSTHLQSVALILICQTRSEADEALVTSPR